MWRRCFISLLSRFVLSILCFLYRSHLFRLKLTFSSSSFSFNSFVLPHSFISPFISSFSLLVCRNWISFVWKAKRLALSLFFIVFFFFLNSFTRLLHDFLSPFQLLVCRYYRVCPTGQHISPILFSSFFISVTRLFHDFLSPFHLLVCRYCLVCFTGQKKLLAPFSFPLSLLQSLVLARSFISLLLLRFILSFVLPESRLCGRSEGKKKEEKYI